MMTRTGILIILIISMLFSTNAMAFDNTGVNESLINERPVDVEEVLNKLNSGRAPEDYLTELPMEAEIEVPDDFIPDDSPLEHFYADDMTDEEIEIVLQRIANGENVIFGDGVFSNHSDDLLNEALSNRTKTQSGTARWKAGSGQTHQWLTSRALTILQNDKPSVYNWFLTSEKQLMTEYSDWPDNNETKDYNSWHFYHYATGTNYWWNRNDTHTAKSRFSYWYGQAVAQGKNANWNTAAQHLGKAIHYLSDMGTPCHTGERAINPALGIDPRNLIQASNHSTYEQRANDAKSLYAVSTASYYNWFISNTTSYIADINSSISSSYYANCYSSDATLRNPTIEWPLKYTQQDVAGLIYKYFYDVTGWTS